MPQADQGRAGYTDTNGPGERDRGTTAGGEWDNRKVPEGLKASPSGGPNGSNQLPRDKNSLSLPLLPRLAPVDFRRGLVTGNTVVVFLRHGRGTNSTARIQNASGCCAAGRQLNANLGRDA